MKIENITNHEDEIIYKYLFYNLYEVVNYIKTTKPYCDKWSMASQEYSPSTKGVESFCEAMDLCLNGYKNNFEALLSEITKLEKFFPHLTNRRCSKPSIYGFRPNINKVMTGNPNAMYKLVRNDKNNFVKIFFDLSYPWKDNVASIMNRGVITITLIKLLESLGMRVDLKLFELVCTGNEYIYLNFSLKTPSQLLDTSICNFPMCHAAFFRCICFAIFERINVMGNLWKYTYGTVCSDNNIERILEIDENNDLLISPPGTIGINGYDIINDTINLIEYTNFNKLFKNNQKLIFDKNQKKFILTR